MKSKPSIFNLVLSITLIIGSPLFAQIKNTAQLPVFTVDAAQFPGPFRPLNSVNGGPSFRVGNSHDYSKYFESFRPPLVRLHDARYCDEGTVDIHEIFPDFNADENDPSNYQFEKTDNYLKSIRKIGSDIFYRLGESIEHGFPKYYVNLPPDFDKWARICAHIVQHYNMGWANGFKWNIYYWEIWNEPNITSCWTGSMKQYCELYKQTAVTLKKLDPELKVGGPALAGPIFSPKGREFLDFCRENKVPLDFISWHGYDSSPDKLLKQIEKSLATIKEYGFDDVETYVTEWNMVTSWQKNDPEKARESFSQTAGSPGAAFAVSVLAYLQNSKLDGAYYYSAYGGFFRLGFFDIFGVPKKPMYSFIAYNKLVELGTRVAVTGNNRETGVGIIGAVNRKTGTTAVLLSNFEDKATRFMLKMKNLPFKKQLLCTEYLIDDNHSLEWDREQVMNSSDFQIAVELPKSTVRLIIFSSQPIK